MRSMWAPSVRWQAVTPQGFEGDRLIPGEYDGSAESLERVRINVLRSTEIGRLISDNFKSSIVETYVFLLIPAMMQCAGILLVRLSISRIWGIFLKISGRR